MLTFDHAIATADANNLGTVDIDENTVGISIEPHPDSNDGFTYGIGSDPQVHVEQGDPGRDYGFVNGACGFEMIKPCQIKIRWDGFGNIKKVLVIKTMYIAEN